MKKIITLFVFILLLTSCSKGKESSTINTEVQAAESIQSNQWFIEGSDTIAFLINSVKEADLSYSMIYTPNRLTNNDKELALKIASYFNPTSNKQSYMAFLFDFPNATEDSEYYAYVQDVEFFHLMSKK